MTRPDFSSLFPPVVIDDWPLATETFRDWCRRKVKESMKWAAQVGYDTAVAEASRQAWPSAITDRKPTAADGDKHGWVQYLDGDGFWRRSTWQAVASDGDPWMHAPGWEKRPEPTLNDVAETLARDHPRWRPDLQEVIRQAVENLGVDSGKTVR